MSELSEISRFRWLLAWLANNLVPEEINKVQTLLQEQLADVDMGDGALGILDTLVRQNRIHDEDTGLLRALLISLERTDLLEAVDSYDREKCAVARLLKKNSSGFGGPFFGHQDTLGNIVTILDTDYDHIHAICISGEAGIGKTRIAQEACSRMNGSHKIVTVDLRGLHSMKSVYFAIMHAFGVETTEHVPEQLYEHLRDYECSAPDGNTILFLDNASSMLNPGSATQPNPAYRQFTDAMRTITSIPNPRLKVMMTSVYHLDMKARLSSKVVNGFRLFPHNGLDSDAAVRMFRYHAGNTTVTYEGAEEVITICGKNPLALKMAANRLQDGNTLLKDLLPTKTSPKADITSSVSRLQISQSNHLQQCLRSTLESLPENHKLNIIKLAAIPGCFSLDTARKVLKSSRKNSKVLPYNLQELKYFGLLEIHRTTAESPEKVSVYSITESLRTFVIEYAQSDDYLKEFHKAQRRHFQFYGKKLRKICKMVEDDLCNALIRLRQDSANYLGFLETLKKTDDFRPSENLWVIVATELLLSPDEGQKFFGYLAEQAKDEDDQYAFADLKCYQIRHLNNLGHNSQDLLHQLQEVKHVLDQNVYGEVNVHSKQLSLATLYCLRGELLAKINKVTEAKQMIQQAEILQRQLAAARTAHRFLVDRAISSTKVAMKTSPTAAKTFVLQVAESKEVAKVKKVPEKTGDESSSSCSSALEGRLITKRGGKTTKQVQSSSEDESSSSCSDTLEVRLPSKKKGKAVKKDTKQEDESSSSCASDLEVKLPPRKKTTRTKQDSEDALPKSLKVSGKFQGRIDKNSNNLNRHIADKSSKGRSPSGGSGDSAVDSGSVHSSDEMAKDQQQLQQQQAYHY